MKLAQSAIIFCTSLLLVSAAAAQSSSAAPSQPLGQAAPSKATSQLRFPVPPLTQAVRLPDPKATAKQSAAADALAKLVIESRVAANTQSCYTLRSYGFTANDLKSGTPRPSIYSTCTSTTSARLKGLEAPHLHMVPAVVSPVDVQH